MLYDTEQESFFVELKSSHLNIQFNINIPLNIAKNFKKEVNCFQMEFNQFSCLDVDYKKEILFDFTKEFLFNISENSFIFYYLSKGG